MTFRARSMLSTKSLLSNKYSYEMSESYFSQESYFERHSWQIIIGVRAASIPLAGFRAPPQATPKLARIFLFGRAGFDPKIAGGIPPAGTCGIGFAPPACRIARHARDGGRSHRINMESPRCRRSGARSSRSLRPRRVRSGLRELSTSCWCLGRRGFRRSEDDIGCECDCRLSRGRCTAREELEKRAAAQRKK